MVKALSVTFPERWIPCFVANGTPDEDGPPVTRPARIRGALAS
jgi:hypothetical protein